MEFDWLIMKIQLPLQRCNEYARFRRLLHDQNWRELRKLVKVYKVCGGKVWSDGYNLLDSVIKRKDPRLVDLLLIVFFSLSPVVEEKKEFSLLQFILFLAIVHKDKLLIDQLVYVGVSVNDPLDKETALCAAIRMEAGLDIIRVIIDHGACVNGRRNLVFKAINKASRAGIISDLLAGADANSKGCFVRTALHEACLVGNGPVVAVLLNHGADINAVDSSGNTPFMTLNKTRLAMKIVAQGNWFGYDNGEAIAGPSTPLFHLQRHAFKTHLLGLYLHSCFKPVLELEFGKDFINACKKQIESMKASRIGTSYLRFYDIIRQEHDPAYLNNQNVMSCLYGKIDPLNEFLMFHGILKDCIRRAEMRNKLLDSGQKCFSDVIRLSSLNILPNEVIRKIISNLKDEELQILTNN